MYVLARAAKPLVFREEETISRRLKTDTSDTPTNNLTTPYSPSSPFPYAEFAVKQEQDDENIAHKEISRLTGTYLEMLLVLLRKYFFAHFKSSVI